MARLTVLGGCGAWPEPGRACSGFVLEHGGFRIVLDLGYGTLPRLLALLRSTAGDGIDAVVVTHAHPDHMVDLHGLFRARCFGDGDGASIALYAPPEVATKVAALEDPDTAAQLERVFDLHPLPAGAQPLGPFSLSCVTLPHHILNVGVRLAAPDLTVAYTGDTGPDPALHELGLDADLFIVDATRPAPPERESAEPRLLLTAAEAGAAAARANARRLLLTHLWPGSDRELAVRVAREAFAGEIHVADEGAVIEL